MHKLNLIKGDHSVELMEIDLSYHAPSDLLDKLEAQTTRQKQRERELWRLRNEDEQYEWDS